MKARAEKTLEQVPNYTVRRLKAAEQKGEPSRGVSLPEHPETILFLTQLRALTRPVVRRSWSFTLTQPCSHSHVQPALSFGKLKIALALSPLHTPSHFLLIFIVFIKTSSCKAPPGTVIKEYLD